MPVTFIKQKPETLTIEKDGTKFYFEVTAVKRKRARMGMYLSAEHDPAQMMVDLFRTALVGWDNLQDQDGKQVPFSIAVRDSLIDETEVFNDADVFSVIMAGTAAAEPKADEPIDGEPGDGEPVDGEPGKKKKRSRRTAGRT